jgi:hypothetical protein
MQKKNKKKSKKGKETQKNVQDKMGFDLELGFFYNPLDLGLEVIASSKHCLHFFLSN